MRISLYNNLAIKLSFVIFYCAFLNGGVFASYSEDDSGNGETGARLLENKDLNLIPEGESCPYDESYEVFASYIYKINTSLYKSSKRKELKTKAEKGDREAIRELAKVMYQKKHYEDAAYWCERGIEPEYYYCKKLLAKMIITERVEGTKEFAYSLTCEAAESGSISSCYNLAILLEEGIGVDRNPPAAVNWYNKGAQRGDRGCFKKLRTIAKTNLKNETFTDEVVNLARKHYRFIRKQRENQTETKAKSSHRANPVKRKKKTNKIRK